MTTNQFVKTMRVTLSVVMSQSCSLTTVVVTVLLERQHELAVHGSNLCMVKQTELNTHCNNKGYTRAAI